MDVEEEEASPSLVSGAIDDVMNALAIRCAKEAPHRGVVVPAPDTVRAGPEPLILQQRLAGVRR